MKQRIFGKAVVQLGAWGTSLYANDSACDLRGDYVEKLKSGKSNPEATQELLEEYQAVLEDPEEGALFWFALADTQWNYGRLLPEVKEKALYYLSRNEEQDRWAASGSKNFSAWQKTLLQLQEKLSSPQPKEKRVSPFRPYHCKWNLGDIFAYQLTSDYSKSLGYDRKYVAFRKVSEDTWYPMHVVPVIQIYLWMGDEIPTIDSLKELPVLPSFTKPQMVKDTPAKCLEKNLKLICESEKSIPKGNLVFVGNDLSEDIIPFQGHDHWTGYASIGWESSKYNHKFEHYVLDMYLAWKDQLK